MRSFLDTLEPWQRGVLVVLSVAVLVTAIVLAVVVATRGPSEQGPRETTTTTSPASSTSTTPTSTTTSSPTSSTSTSTSTTTSTTTTTPTTITMVPPESLMLRPDGLGDADFGTGAAEAVESVEAVLGDPDLDTGWLPVSQVGACIGSEVRFVRWGSLQIFLTDGPSDWGPAGVRHLAAYDHAAALGSPVHPLQTDTGISIGTPVGDVRAILGTDAVTGEEGFAPVFTIDPPGPGYQWGGLSGLDPTDVVESISGGFSCAD
jgi:hypothetical protein